MRGTLSDKAPVTALGLRRSVVLVGMMGCGKTAVGTALSEALDVPFRDTDVAIEEASRMTVEEIFARDGEPFFRRREGEVVRRLLDARPAGVLSTGGGAFLRAENRDAIGRAGFSVWLRADLDILWSRVKGRTHRPLLRTADPRGTLARMFSEREAAYALADVAVAAERDTSVEEMARRVVGALRRAGVLT